MLRVQSQILGDSACDSELPESLLCSTIQRERSGLLPAGSTFAGGPLSRLNQQGACMSREMWELWSYIVTVIGLPLAIGVFLYEQWKERDNEESEVYLSLSDNYQDFLKVALDNPDLKLFSTNQTPDLTDEQKEQMLILFSMLVSLFERAFLLLYEPRMTPAQSRRWRSWEDYMREWCRRQDFVDALPQLMRGEDEEFVEYLRRVVASEVGTSAIP